MAVKLKTDLSGQIEFPTLILTNRNGNRLGVIEAYDIVYSDSFLDADEFTFKTKKYWNGVLNPIWDEITDLKIIWCEEYDSSFQISVEIDEEDDTTKIVSAIKLAHSELSQIMLYNIEINTEDDIAREDYIKPTVFYNKNDKSISLLNRLLEKAPHYMIIHVDSTLCNIQRTFSFDGTSIYDAFNDIAEEIGCVFIYPNEGNAGKSITRRISVFDLYSNCKDCGYRGDFIGCCPECGSSNIINGYGEDTGIFVTSDELGQQLNVKGDIDSVKNCLRLEAGDDLMTATIKNCNPNGTQYLWNITSSIKQDMQKELSDKIDSYSKLVQDYETTKEFNLSNDNIRNYNSTIEKYQKYNNRFNKIELPIIGFNGLIETEYNILDLQLFIQTGLMPDASLSDTTAEQQIKIVEDNLKIVSVSNLKALSIASANSAILGYVKCILDNRYTATIVDTPILSNNVWNGILKITNNSDENDSGNTNSLSVEINDDYKNYVLQKVDKIINKNQVDNVSISGIFKLSLDEFKSEMKKYSIDMLVNFHDACQAVVDVLTEQGVGTKETWAGKDPNLYADLYVPYYNKLETLEDELNSKETDLSFVSNTKSEVDTYITNVHNILDFEKYLGTDLWKDFCAYRREDTYRNENFVSDGLDNKELIGKATEFYKLAKSEIFKSAEIQYSISTTLNNLLVLDKFKPIVNSFKTGNWIRVKVDDKIYKLRLLKYEIDYSNIENINVEFSTALRDSYGINAQKAIILAAKAMSTSYNYVQKQVSKGEKTDDTVSDWKQNGLDATNTQIIGGSDYQNQIWDSHGLLLRKYDNIENKYEDNQMKIVNSTIAITNDNWETVKTAIGYYFYTDNNGELKSTYGINAETIVGKLVLGNELYFSNETNTMTFDQNGLTVSNGTNTFIVNPGDVNLLKIKKGEEDVFYVDQDGKLHITGDGTYIDVSSNEVIEGIKADILSVQKTSHTHENKSILDKTEQPYTTAERDKLAGLENYTHPAHTAHAKGFYKFASDDEGHVEDAETVTKEDITALGIPSENTRYKFTVDGTGLEINQSTSADFYRLKFPSTRSITSLIPYFPNTYDNERGYCWCQLAFTVVESTAHDYKKIGIEGGYEQGERIYYEPQGVAKIAIALYGVAGRRGVSITADLPLHNAKLFEVRPLENLKIFSSAPEKKLSVYAVGRYSSIDTAVGGKTNYDLYLFLYADESYTATAPGVRVTVETSVYPFGGGCAEVNRNYSNVVQMDSSAISESIRMSAVKTEAVTDILASKANKDDIPDISGKQDKLTAGTNITISGNTISAKDTTYTSKSAVNGGTDVSLVTTGEKAIWNAKTSNVGTITGIKMNGASKGTSGVVDLGTVITAHQDISGKQDKSTAVTHIANTAVGSTAKPVYIAADGKATPITHSINADVPANAKFTDTTYSDATQSAHGLMTAADKKKLDGMDLSQYLPLHGTADKAKDLASGAMRYGSCVNGTTSFNDGYKWFRIGSMIPTSNGYDTETMCLQVYQGYNTYGVLGVYTRSDKTGLKSDNLNVRWFIRSSNALPSFKLVAIESSTGLAYELWCAVPQRYQQTHCTVMADIALTGGMANRWVMYTLTASDAQTATTAGAKSVTDEDLSYAAKATEATTLTDSGWSSVTTYVVDKSKFNNISTEFRRIGQIAWVKCSFTPNVAMTNITICDVVNVDPFVAVTPANTVYGVGSNNDGTESFIATISYNPDRKLYLRGNFKASTIYRLMFSYPVT